jgi:hypothetical protein
VKRAIEANNLPVVRAMYDAGWRLPDTETGRKLLFMASMPDGGVSIEILEYLISTVGCDPRGPSYLPNEEGTFATTLHMACQHGTLEQASLLIWAGADVEERDSADFPPLVYALHGLCSAPHILYKYLVYCGADRTLRHLTPEEAKEFRLMRHHVSSVSFDGLTAEPRIRRHYHINSSQLIVCQSITEISSAHSTECQPAF